MISEAWIKKVVDGPVIQANNRQLREFADQLQTCAETLKALGMLDQISNRRELIKIVERLPYHLRSRWLRQVKHIRDNNRNPNIMDVVNFINDVAEEMNDPVFGTLLQSGVKANRTSPSRQVPSKGNFATSVSTPTPHRCILCREPHSLFGCNLFKEMKPDQRFHLAQQHILCFNCLRPGHMWSKCTLNRTCSVKGCTLKHTKFLHNPSARDSRSGQSADSRSRPSQSADSGSSQSADSTTQTDQHGSSNVESSSHTSSDGKGAGYRVALPTIPVQVRAANGNAVTETFALLDSGSTNSYWTQELADSLEAKGKQDGNSFHVRKAEQQDAV